MQRMFSDGDIAEDSLEAAQQIMHDAFGADSPGRQVQLAKQALERSPDCADAYVLLAEHARSLDEALHFYEQGVAAGVRALGDDGFRQMRDFGDSSRRDPTCVPLQDWPMRCGSLDGMRMPLELPGPTATESQRQSRHPLSTCVRAARAATSR